MPKTAKNWQKIRKKVKKRKLVNRQLLPCVYFALCEQLEGEGKVHFDFIDKHQ